LSRSTTESSALKGNRLRKIAGRIVALGISLGVAMLLAELAVRLTISQPQNYLDIFQHHPVIPVYTPRPMAERELPGEAGRWVALTDQDGFRTTRAPRPPQSAPAVLMLGDSFTFGVGVNFEQSFPGLLEQAWNGRYRVVNAGVIGYGPIQYRSILEYQLSRGMTPARVIVVTYLGNDFFDCFWEKNHPITEGILNYDGSLWGSVKRSSQLIRLVGSARRNMGPRKSEVSELDRELIDPAAWSKQPLAGSPGTYRAEFEKILRITSSRNIPLTVCVIPMWATVQFREGKPPKVDSLSNPDFEHVPAVATRILKDLRIDTIDLTADLVALGHASAKFKADDHLSPAGNQVVADAILKHLQPAPVAKPENIR
jgi:lysophospholipase L1-like esterase